MANQEVDFTGVPERGPRRPRFPSGIEGDYKLKVVKVEENEKSKAGNPQWIVTFLGLTGAVKGKKGTEYFALVPDALWKLRDFLEALGLKVSGKKAKLNPQKLVDKVVGAHIQDGEPFGDKGIVNGEIGYYLSAGEVGAAPAADSTPVSEEAAAPADEPDAPADSADEDEFDLDAI